MKVFVAGATGVVGRPAVRQLVADGHAVTAVARSPEKAALLRSLGASPVSVDLFDATAVRAAVVGHDAVMNLATHIPSLAKMALSSSWEENDRIRREVSRNLVDAALAAGARHYVQESIAFIYPDTGDAWHTEDDPVDVVPYVASTLDAEGQAQRFTDAGGVGVVLRFGFFQAPESEQTQAAVRLARQAGTAMLMGRADGYMSLIHADDAGAAAAAALRAPAGIYNIVEDEPMTRRDSAAALASAVGRRRLRMPPAALAKAGGSRASLLARSQRISNARFKSATGWSPRYPSARETWAAIAAAVLEHPGERREPLARVLLGFMALVSLSLAIWPLLSPHSWYTSFPGLGRHWITVNGPYNEHFVRDFGALNLALGIVTAWAAVQFRRELARAASVALIAFGTPHLLYHLFHLDVYTSVGDQIANVVSLGAAVLVPIIVLVLVRTPRPRAGAAPVHATAAATVGVAPGR